MKTLCTILISVFLAVPLVGQNPVEEAKAKRVKQHHEVQVERARGLLELKESLEKQLADVDAKLAKLANGEDVPEESVVLGSSGSSSVAAITWTCCSNCISCPHQ